MKAESRQSAGAQKVGPAGSAPPAARTGYARRRWVLRAVLLAGCGAAGWWLFRPDGPAPAPPLPENVTKPELRAAIEGARHKVEDAPRSAAAWGELGVLLLAHKCYPEADVCFAEAARLEPDSPDWCYFRYMVAVRLNPDPEQHLALLRRANGRASALREDGRSAVRLRLAEALLEHDDLAEAEALYRAERDRHPESQRAALGLARIAVRRGDDRAAAQLLTALRATPAARQVAQLLATVSRRQNDLAAAGRYEQQLSRLGPDSDWPDPFYTRMYDAEIPELKARDQIPRLVQQGAYHEAAQLCEARLKNGPQYSLYMGAGVNFVRAGAFERGLEMLRAAQRLEPDNPYAAFATADALLAWGNADRERNPAAPTAAGHWREAVAAARRVIELKPSHAEAYLVLGQAQILLGEPRAAVDALQRGTEYRPEMFALQYYLGVAHLEAGQLREAERRLDNARKLDPTSPLPDKMLERARAAARP
jgi:cytochrome c-type biogenesis protein CcmH/NrfG